MGLFTSSLNRITVESLEDFNKNGKSYATSKDNELHLGNCQITDEMLNEIILEWLINKNILNKIKLLL